MNWSWFNHGFVFMTMKLISEDKKPDEQQSSESKIKKDYVLTESQLRRIIESDSEEILNGEVVYTQGTPATFRMEVEEVLKSEPVSTRRQKLRQETKVEEILNAEGVSADSQIFIQEALFHQVLSSMIETTTPHNSDYFRVEDVLTHHNSSITE